MWRPGRILSQLLSRLHGMSPEVSYLIAKGAEAMAREELALYAFERLLGGRPDLHRELEAKIKEMAFRLSTLTPAEAEYRFRVEIEELKKLVERVL